MIIFWGILLDIKKRWY